MRLEEVKTCMYLAEVQHPGAQNNSLTGLSLDFEMVWELPSGW